MTAPERFRFTEAGYLEGGSAVELVGGALVRRRVPRVGGDLDELGPQFGRDSFALLYFNPPPSPHVVRPSADDWRAFRRALDRLRVWNWAPSYEDPMIIDGGYWDLSVKWCDRELKSWGRNAWPPAWQGFLRALHRLTREAGWLEVDGEPPPSSAVRRRRWEGISEQGGRR